MGLLGIVAAVVFMLPAIAAAVTVTADFTHGNDDTTYVDAAILAANWTGRAEGTVVPEPASLVLLGIGVLTLSIGRRRRPTPHCVSSE